MRPNLSLGFLLGSTGRHSPADLAYTAACDRCNMQRHRLNVAFGRRQSGCSLVGDMSDNYERVDNEGNGDYEGGKKQGGVDDHWCPPLSLQQAELCLLFAAVYLFCQCAGEQQQRLSHLTVL